MAGGAYAAYGLLRDTLDTHATYAEALRHTRTLVGHGHIEAALWHLGQASRLDYPLGAYYATAHLLVTAAVLAWALRTGRAAAAAPLLVLSLVALVVYAAWPMLPPRLYLDGGHAIVGPAAALAVPWAAMPSLHCAWAGWVDRTLRTSSSRWARRGGLAHLVVTLAAVLLCGQHWLVDAAAGLALQGASTAVVERLCRHRPAVLPTAASARSTVGATT